jgi:hypothetical protein
MAFSGRYSVKPWGNVSRIAEVSGRDSHRVLSGNEPVLLTATPASPASPLFLGHEEKMHLHPDTPCSY